MFHFHDFFIAGIKMSHASTTALCRAMKLQCELYPSRHVALCLDPYCGLGFALWCLSSVYSGHHTILIPPSEVETNPAVWLTAVSQYKVRDTFCSYGKNNCLTRFQAVNFRFNFQTNSIKYWYSLLSSNSRCYGIVYKRARWVSSSAETKERKLGLCQNMCGRGWRKAKNCTHSIIYKTIFGIKSVSTSSFNFVWMSREHSNLLTSMLHYIVFQYILLTFKIYNFYWYHLLTSKFLIGCKLTRPNNSLRGPTSIEKW